MGILRMREHCVSLAWLFLLPGCVTTLDTDTVGTPERMARSAVASGQYRGPEFTLVNRTAYPTELTPGDLINVYVSRAGAQQYTRVDPNSTGSAITMYDGFVIVREVLTQNSVSKLTIMVKGPPGYFPGGGDYFYAVTSADGLQYLPDDSGAPQVGAIQVCGDCHAQRANDDFLFGVPAFRRQ